MYKPTFAIGTQWWRVIWEPEYAVHTAETWKPCSPDAEAEGEVARIIWPPLIGEYDTNLIWM